MTTNAQVNAPCARRSEMLPHAVKKFGRYKSAIKHRTHVNGDYWRENVEFLGTQYGLTQDGRDMVVTKGAPLYDTREQALAQARLQIDFRATDKAKRDAATAERRERYARQFSGNSGE